jgi:DNA primase
VTQTILSLRCDLIDMKVSEFQKETIKADANTTTIMEDVRDYLRLKTLLAKKLGKVVGSKV